MNQGPAGEATGDDLADRSDRVDGIRRSGCLASFVDRLDRGGLVTDAFINGQDLIGGMGGEMVDVIIADAVAKEVPGVDAAADPVLAEAMMKTYPHQRRTS